MRGASRMCMSVIIGLSDRNSISNETAFIHIPKADRGLPTRFKCRPSARRTSLMAGHLANPHLVVKRERASISHLPKIGVGTKPVDGGHYILAEKEKADLVAREPRAADLLRPFVGGAEYINNRGALDSSRSPASPPVLLRSLPNVMDKIQAVRHYRANQAGRLGQSLAERPTEYHVSVIPDAEFLGYSRS